MKKIVSFILAIVMTFTVIAVSPFTMSVSAVERVDENSTGRRERNPTISKSLKVGDEFFAGIDIKTGKLNGKLADDSYDLDDPMYRCVVKEDGTVSIEFFYWSPAEFLGAAAFLNPETLEAGKELIIPSKVNGCTVTEIAANWGGFGNTGVKKIVIPETVTKIDNIAFRNNFFVEEIVFDGKSKLKEIGHGAFMDCRSLKAITIPASVETIGEYAFSCTDMSVPADAEIRKGDWHYMNGHLGGNFMTIFGTIDDAVEITSVDDNNQTIKYRINKPELIFDDVYSLTTVKFEGGSKLKNLVRGTFAFQKALTYTQWPIDLETISLYAYFETPVFVSILESASSLGATIVDLPEDDDDSTSSEKPGNKTDSTSTTKPVSKGCSINSSPVINSAVSKSAGTIELSWTDAGASGYIVYIAKDGVGNFVKSGTFTGNSATITTIGKNTKLQSGSTYLVRVIRSDYMGELSDVLGKYVPAKVTVK